MNVLGVFAKYFEPGRVKTRLAMEIGCDPACELYETFAGCALRTAGGMADRHDLVFTPPDSRNRFREWLSAQGHEGWRLVPQAEGDLGIRMRSYLETAFAEGAERIVLLGSDAPTLPARYLEQAFALLESVPLVIGPSDDGGYYALGARKVPPVFDGIAWSTGRVLEQTLQRLDNARWKYELLPTWYDVDSRSELLRLQQQVQASSYDGLRWKSLRACVARAIEELD